MVPSIAVSQAHAQSVSAIVVEGNQRIETDTVLSYLQLSPAIPSIRTGSMHR